jgi:hypothetical protein
MGKATSIGELLNNVTMNNVVKQSLTNNDQCNNVRLWKTNRISSDEAESKARFLVERLNAPNCRNFFLKCIYHLSESEIQSALECSTRPYVKSPIKYFNRICKTKLTQRGL